MARRKRPDAEVQADRESTRIAATLAGDLRATRRRRRLSQAELGARIGVGQGRISDLERGRGAGAPLDTWIALGLALGRPLAVAFSRDLEPPAPRDAGHLAGQELLLRHARHTGRRADVELPTRPAEPSHSIDVCLRDDRQRTLIVNEIWNRVDDVGAAYRASSRKVAQASAQAAFAGGDGEPYRVAVCWLLVDTAANRLLTRRYPELFSTRFPGSSEAWVQCLVAGEPPPLEPGVVWLDTRAGRIRPRRRARQPAGPPPGIGG
jgi:transcriptional regulator with XRE-family HTH domain